MKLSERNYTSKYHYIEAIKRCIRDIKRINPLKKYENGFNSQLFKIGTNILYVSPFVMNENNNKENIYDLLKNDEKIKIINLWKDVGITIGRRLINESIAEDLWRLNCLKELMDGNYVITYKMTQSMGSDNFIDTKFSEFHKRCIITFTDGILESVTDDSIFLSSCTFVYD